MRHTHVRVRVCTNSNCLTVALGSTSSNQNSTTPKQKSGMHANHDEVCDMDNIEGIDPCFKRDHGWCRPATQCSIECSSDFDLTLGGFGSCRETDVSSRVSVINVCKWCPVICLNTDDSYSHFVLVSWLAHLKSHTNIEVYDMMARNERSCNNAP